MTPEEKAQEIVLHLHGPDGDSLYHTKKVISDAIKLFLLQERERCYRAAEARTSYSIPGSKDFDLGWKRCAEAIARDIGTGPY